MTVQPRSQSPGREPGRQHTGSSHQPEPPGPPGGKEGHGGKWGGVFPPPTVASRGSEETHLEGLGLSRAASSGRRAEAAAGRGSGAAGRLWGEAPRDRPAGQGRGGRKSVSGGPLSRPPGTVTGRRQGATGRGPRPRVRPQRAKAASAASQRPRSPPPAERPPGGEAFLLRRARRLRGQPGPSARPPVATRPPARPAACASLSGPAPAGAPPSPWQRGPRPRR